MIFDSISNNYRRWREQRRTVAALSRLSPRELDDIGLAPYQIKDAARGRFRR